MNSEQFRKAGYELIEYAARYMETITDREPLPHVTPGWLAKIMPTEAPQKPEGWDSIMKDVEKVIMEGSTHWMHPQFHAYFSNGNSWPSILGDILSNGLGVNGTTWVRNAIIISEPLFDPLRIMVKTNDLFLFMKLLQDSCPAVTELELIVVDWAAKFLDLPKFFWSHLSNPESEGGGSIQVCSYPEL
jgi:glutamate/tyrosine decarboxylase-like PLP-dependent enzyme